MYRKEDRRSRNKIGDVSPNSNTSTSQQGSHRNLPGHDTQETDKQNHNTVSWNDATHTHTHISNQIEIGGIGHNNSGGGSNNTMTVGGVGGGDHGTGVHLDDDRPPLSNVSSFNENYGATTHALAHLSQHIDDHILNIINSGYSHLFLFLFFVFYFCFCVNVVLWFVGMLVDNSV